jgi:hypothetical protein
MEPADRAHQGGTSIDTDRIDRRYFGWTALVAGALGLALLGLYGYRTFVDLAAGNAYRHGTLTVQTASIVHVGNFGGDQTGFGSPNASQDVLLRLNDGSIVRYSSQLPSRQHVNLSGRQAVPVGTWHSRLVTVGGVTMAIDGVLWWPLPCFVVSAVAPLVWYAVAEIRSTSPTLDPSTRTGT